MYKFILPIMILFACGSPTGPDEPSRRAYRAVKIDNGDLQWDRATWSQNFVFRGFRGVGNSTPDRTTPTEQTSFKVLYDNDNLYFLIRCYDNGPVTRISETGNWWDSDWVEVNIDGSLSRETASSFTITAGGVFRSDFITGNGADWEEIPSKASGTVTIDEDGWLSEITIPMSELSPTRYKGQIMGLQVHRYLVRNEELSNWQPLVGDFLSEWVSQAGLLLGF